MRAATHEKHVQEPVPVDVSNPRVDVSNLRAPMFPALRRKTTVQILILILILTSADAAASLCDDAAAAGDLPNRGTADVRSSRDAAAVVPEAKARRHRQADWGNMVHVDKCHRNVAFIRDE